MNRIIEKIKEWISLWFHRFCMHLKNYCWQGYFWPDIQKKFISSFYFSKHICLNPILSRSAVILANLSSAIGEIGDRTGPISIPWIYFIIDLFTWSLNPYWNIISRTWVKRVWRSDACSFLFAFTSIVIDRFYSNSNNYSYGLMSFTIVIIMANWSFEGQKYFD